MSGYSRPMNVVDLARACHEACRAAGETRRSWDQLSQLEQDAHVRTVSHFIEWSNAEPMNRTDRIFSSITRQLSRFIA